MASNNDEGNDSYNSVETPNSSATSTRSRGTSKAQLSLQKILDTISTPPPPLPHRVHFNTTDGEESSGIASSPSAPLPVFNVSEYESARMGYNLDLNLGPPLDSDTHQDSRPPAAHGGEKVQENEKCLVPERNLDMPEDDGNVMLQDEGFESEMKRQWSFRDNLERAESEEPIKLKFNPEQEMCKREEKTSQKYFQALLDAIEVALAEYENDGDSKTRNPSEPIKTEDMINDANGRKRQRLERKIEEDEQMAVKIAREVSTSPVVKSNRGRCQVLPYKYRDSVMEPLKQLSSRHRGSSAANGLIRRRLR